MSGQGTCSMSRVDCHQGSFDHYIFFLLFLSFLPLPYFLFLSFLFFFKRTVLFVFSLGPWTIQSCLSPKQYCVLVPYCGVDLKSISYCLVTPTNFLQEGHYFRHRVCGFLGVYISLLIACRVDFCNKDTETQGWNILYWNQLSISIFNEWRRNYLCNGDLLLVSEEQPIALVTVWIIWGFLWGSFWSITILDVTQTWYWKLHLERRDAQLGSWVSPIIW